MPGNVPYNPNLLQETMDGQMGRPVPTVIPPPLPNVVERPGFQHHDRFIARNIGRIAGLSRIMTHDGRLARARQAEIRIQERAITLRRAGDIHDDPRLGDTNPAKKIGWPGIFKFNSTPATRRDEDWVNPGILLTDEKRDRMLPDPDTRTIRGADRTDKVAHRPATHSETRATARMSNLMERSSRILLEAGWPSDHIKDKLDASSGYKVSPVESTNFGNISRDIEGRLAKAKVLRARVEKIARGEDMAGRWANYRLGRAQRRIARG